MIKKIDLIKKMAVFQDFQWTTSVRDDGNNVAEFQNINIVYGRNYSGKTTLSRIFRSLETGSISNKYDSPEFKLSFKDSTNVTQDSLCAHGQVVRVFNKDFVRDNLRFIVDDEQAINSFAIMGKDNIKLNEEIEKYEAELGKEEDRSGLRGAFLDAEKKYTDAQNAFKDKSQKLEVTLNDKANKPGTGIKHNRLIGDANYNVLKIKADITAVTTESYQPLSDEEVSEFYNLLRETPKQEIHKSLSFNLKYSTIALDAKQLVEKKIKISDPIQELLKDSVLANWVKTGREQHQGKRDKCAFCGNHLPLDLWEKLDKHFNHESEELERSLNDILKSIEYEKAHVPELLKINSSEFYSNFANDLKSLSEKLSTHTASYCVSLDAIKDQVQKRKDDILTPISFNEPIYVEGALNAVRDVFEQLREKSNQFTASLSIGQANARNALRLHEIHKFANDIKYEDECKAIAILKEAMRKAEEIKEKAKENINTVEATIIKLRDQMKNETQGAQRVTDYLRNSFGHYHLSLKVIEENPGDAKSGYRFEVIRNDKKAFHLSEGECSLIAFCYFMAKLEDIETKGKKAIIWIDDPISSLDANHIFFVYSLIKAIIVEPKNFSQLFISTHNLDFLKYLTRIDKDKGFFLLERSGDTSKICLMPEYLKKYITEFNYLFHQIYKCAFTQINDGNYHEFYNFGNNARKFLEIYLYYRYPNGNTKDDKLLKFFGEDSIPAIFAGRLNHEYSHLLGGFERGASPIEVPEIKAVAEQIILKIRNDDYNQFSAFLESIGVKEDPFDTPHPD